MYSEQFVVLSYMFQVGFGLTFTITAKNLDIGLFKLPNCQTGEYVTRVFMC